MRYRRKVRSKELPCLEVPKHKGDNSSEKQGKVKGPTFLQRENLS